MTKSILLTKERVALVDDNDYERVARFKWSFDGRYAQSWIAGRQVRLHCFILVTEQGEEVAEQGEEVDHIDGDKLNCQKFNLRPATRSTNMQNLPKRGGTSRYKGVSKNNGSGKLWRAFIRINGRSRSLGYHDTEEDAAIAYDQAALGAHGRYARVNFPDGC